MTRRWPIDVVQALKDHESFRYLSRYLFPIRSTSRPHFWALCIQRMAAIAVEIKLYKADHRQRPASLDQLVPDYLPAILLDPNRGTIRYKPDGMQSVIDNAQYLSDEENTGLLRYRIAILHSVGNNTKDDGGFDRMSENGVLDHEIPYSDTNEGGPTDQWFGLAPRAATAGRNCGAICCTVIGCSS